jgi:phthalate 4,5-cis-dihydrodiol dehydrogenase
MNLGIIGYGYAGQQHARAVSGVRGISVGAIAEPDEKKRRQISVRAFADYRSLLEDPQIDAVSICLPHHLHEEVAAAALQAGKHVLVEKPLAVDAAGGRRLCKLSKRLKKILMVEMTHRFLPPLQEAKRLIARGVIGRIVAVDEYLIEGIGLFGTLPRWMLFRKSAGGGVALTSGIHLLDHIAWICGKPLILDAACFSSGQKLGDIEDTAAFFLRLSNGAPVHIVLCWRKADGELDSQLTVVGSEGTLKVSPWGNLSMLTKGSSINRKFFHKDSSTSQRALVGMTGAIREFAKAIQNARAPNPPPEDSLASQSLIEQAYQEWSTKRGRGKRKRPSE